MMRTLDRLKDAHHGSCFFYPNRFNLDYTVKSDGSLEAEFFCDEQYQGYDRRMHGGILSALIDSAMTWCLFARGIVAYTVRLNLQFARLVDVGKAASIVVHLRDVQGRVARLDAVIMQDGERAVTADAKFMTE
jgi:acyl-coenzyme A thioesterase PaaI-like protein